MPPPAICGGSSDGCLPPERASCCRPARYSQTAARGIHGGTAHRGWKRPCRGVAERGRADPCWHADTYGGGGDHCRVGAPNSPICSGVPSTIDATRVPSKRTGASSRRARRRQRTAARKMGSAARVGSTGCVWRPTSVKSASFTLMPTVWAPAFSRSSFSASSRDCVRRIAMSSRSSRTSYSKVSSVEMDFVSRSGSTRRGSRPQASSRTRSPHAPKTSRRRASSSCARSPIVFDSERVQPALRFGPDPPQASGRKRRQRLRPRLPVRSPADRPACTRREAIFATIFAAATPALTVNPVADATSRRISAASARASPKSAPSPMSTKASSSDRPSTSVPARAENLEDLARNRARWPSPVRRRRVEDTQPAPCTAASPSARRRAALRTKR